MFGQDPFPTCSVTQPSHQPQLCPLFWLYLQGNRQITKIIPVLFFNVWQVPSFPFYLRPVLSLLQRIPSLPSQKHHSRRSRGHSILLGAWMASWRLKSVPHTQRFQFIFPPNSLIFSLCQDCQTLPQLGLHPTGTRQGNLYISLSKSEVWKERERFLPLLHLLPHPTNHQLWPTSTACTIPSLFLPAASFRYLHILLCLIYTKSLSPGQAFHSVNCETNEVWLNICVQKP